MASRLQLQTDLEELLGYKNVYFQPPETVQMRYPAIKYRLSDIEKDHADDGFYRGLKSYELILIDPNPDSTYVDKIIQLPYCRFDRYYPADNLNHYVFTLYY